jgi:hypothetical protein
MMRMMRCILVLSACSVRLSKRCIDMFAAEE